MVYIGKNMSGNEPVNTHYFQDTVSILFFGLLSEVKDTSDCKISSCVEKEPGTDILTLHGAIKELQKASEKAKRLGYPKLQKARGN